MTQLALPIPPACSLPAGAELTESGGEFAATASEPKVGVEGTWFELWREAQIRFDLDSGDAAMDTGEPPAAADQEDAFDSFCCGFPSAPPPPPDPVCVPALPPTMTAGQAAAWLAPADSFHVQDVGGPSAPLPPPDGPAACQTIRAFVAASAEDPHEARSPALKSFIAAGPEPEAPQAARPVCPETAGRGRNGEHPVAEVLLKPRTAPARAASSGQGEAPPQAAGTMPPPGQQQLPAARSAFRGPENAPAVAGKAIPQPAIKPREAVMAGATGSPQPDTKVAPDIAAGRPRVSEKPAAESFETAFPGAEVRTGRWESGAVEAPQQAPEPGGPRAAAPTAQEQLQSRPPEPDLRSARGRQEPDHPQEAGRPGRTEPLEDNREVSWAGRQLDLQVEGGRGERVRIRLWEAAGSVRMRMTSSEQRVAEVLRSGWPQLERALEQAGWHAEAASAAPSRPADAANARQPALLEGPDRALRLNMVPSHGLSGGALSGQDSPSGGHQQQEAREEWIELSALRRLGAWRQS